MTPEQQMFLAELRGLEDQIGKGHWLNIHFRAFELSYRAWQEHIRANARSGARGEFVAGKSPGGAVLDGERDD
jgi:hypothetical protein